ncbi:MAG: peptide chain release factor N(5)-glutamine methyltransferase, partial [Thermomicrobiales bacterium]|nr:peptide chain release factor N(5)-glutamine methyltransferase [Thermomicrobiales bacterium]
MRTYLVALQHAAERLAGASDSPRLDAEVLLREVTGLDRAGLLFRYAESLPDEQDVRFSALVERRLAGEPIAYILGRRAFRTIDLAVDERVLIPRPETEWIVDLALAWLAQHGGPRRVVDVGTGSGAIALALASELAAMRRVIQIVGVDVSRDALAVARLNRERLGLRQRVDLLASDLLAGLSGPFDLILANLPYLRPDQTHPSTDREPQLALFAGLDGFDLYRRLLYEARDMLVPGGLLVGEIDPAQADLALEVALKVMG